MDAERWNLVEAIFHDAGSIDPAERGAFLDERCGGDAALRAEVESLISAGRETFLETGLPESLGRAGRDALIGRKVGRYRLVELIGEGGMGSVYLGERADGSFEQTVAVKLLRAGGRGLIRRFDREREVLARLEHPGISRLIDAGTTDDGQAYLVMEHVDGEPIDRYCAGRGLGVRDRLGLMLRVCDAIAYTHRNLVIHRDLKPGNILVDEDARPRVIDFGIALPAYLGDAATMHTAADKVLGTVAYMSPEQCERGAGADVDVRSDVYALGVVMYELLTGAKPLDVSSSSLVAAVRRIAEEPPPRPSARNPALRGDLETIILKAIEKSPDRRYQSAGELADDIRRHLEERPVLARRPSPSYLVGKFLRRHRAPLLSATGAVGVGAIVVGAVVFWAIGLPMLAERAMHRARVEVLSPAYQAVLYSPTYFRAPSRTSGGYAQNAVLDAAAFHYDRAAMLGRLGELDRRELAVFNASRVLNNTAFSEWEAVWPKKLGEGVRVLALDEDLEGAIARASIGDLRDAGMLLLLTSQVDRAVRVLQHYETLVPTDAFIEGLLGELYLSLGKPLLAYPRVRAAYDAFPESRTVTLSLAEAAIGAGDLARARLLLDSAEPLPEYDPHDRIARLRAMYFAEAGMEDEAHAAFTAATAFRTTNGRYMLINSVAFYHRARFEHRRGNLYNAINFAVWSMDADTKRLDLSMIAAAPLELFVSLVREHVEGLDRTGVEHMLHYSISPDYAEWVVRPSQNKNIYHVALSPRIWLDLYARARAELLGRPPKIAVAPGDADRFEAERALWIGPDAVTDLAELLDASDELFWSALRDADPETQAEFTGAWLERDIDVVRRLRSRHFPEIGP